VQKTALEKYRKLLLAKRKELLEEMGVLDTTFDKTPKEQAGDLSHHAYHMASGKWPSCLPRSQDGWYTISMKPCVASTREATAGASSAKNG
jgi:hypothetical protein